MLTCFPSSESGCNPNVFSTIVQRFLTRVFHSSSYYNFRFSRLLSASYSTQNNHRFATNFPHPSRILDTILNPIRRIYICTCIAWNDFARWISRLFRGEVDREGRDPQLLAKNFILNLSTWETRNGRDRWPEEECFIHSVDEIFIQRLIRKKKPNSRDRERSYDYHLKYIYIYMYVRGMYIFDCLKTFQWNSWEVYESWIYIDGTSDKTRTRYRQEAISRTYRISYFAITTRHLRRRPRFFHFTIFQKRS